VVYASILAVVLDPGLEVAASVYNLFDVDYAYPGFGEHTQDTIEQDGRTFWVGLTSRS